MAISGGSLQKRTAGIREAIDSWCLRAREWLSQTFYETTPKYLLSALENFYLLALAPRKLLQQSGNVYDLIDVEVSSRFQAINGTILHNCLGIGYLMGPASLADKLTLDTGLPHTEDDANRLIATYFDVYSHYSRWIDNTLHAYKEKGYLTLLDGWVMYGDNPNRRSISNCPVQGAGGCILRRAIKLAQERGLKVIIPLHDALYIEYPEGKPECIDVLAASMMEAFGHYFAKDPITYVWSQAMRLDYDAWGPGLSDGEMTTPGGRVVKTQKIYIDPRGKSEYERFREFF